jgi:hypothetical protein
VPKKTPAVTIEENTGDKFPSLATAQRSALTATVADIANTIRDLLTAGVLINQNGRIIPAPSHN